MHQIFCNIRFVWAVHHTISPIIPKISPIPKISRIFFSGFRMFAAMVASTTHRRHLMVQKIFTPRFIFEAAGFGVSLATMCLSYLTFVRIRGSISKYVKALWLEIIRINTQSNIVLTIYIPNVWYIKNRTKLSNVFLLCLVCFLLHQTLLVRTIQYF